MRKIIIAVMALVIIAAGCSSKTVTFTPTGSRQVVTVTDSSKYSDAQARAWGKYYNAVANPPVIATITQPDGTVVFINSQTPPPTPDIKQHRNQIIEPVERMVSIGVKVVGGGLIIREIVDAMQGTNITNSGAGTVTVDNSEDVAVETTTLDEGSVINKDSNNDESDNHVDNADPVIVEKETVVVVDPEVVNPEVFVIEPSYPPTDVPE